MPHDRLMIDCDETDECVRIWHGAELVGELWRAHPDTPPDDAGVAVAKWSGWLSSHAWIELAGSYSAETKRRAAADA